jgi:hypothetical protein
VTCVALVTAASTAPGRPATPPQPARPGREGGAAGLQPRLGHQRPLQRLVCLLPLGLRVTPEPHRFGLGGVALTFHPAGPLPLLRHLAGQLPPSVPPRMASRSAAGTSTWAALGGSLSIRCRQRPMRTFRRALASAARNEMPNASASSR